MSDPQENPDLKPEFISTGLDSKTDIPAAVKELPLSTKGIVIKTIHGEETDRYSPDSNYGGFRG